MSALFVLVLVACGISLSAGEQETEVFKELAIEGDLHAGSTLSLTLTYEQPYAVAVDVVCDLLEADPDWTPTPTPTPGPTSTPTPVVIPRVKPTPANKLREILRAGLPPNEQGGVVGEATPMPGTVEREFAAPERPGRYLVRCYTPDDDNNAIVERITIAPAPTVMP